MKRSVFVAAVMAVLSFSLASCEGLELLENYEEQLSLSSEEWEQLVPGKWKLTDAGYSTYLDDVYGEDRIDKEGYPEVSCSIESIEILPDDEAVINFKKEVTFEVTIPAETKTITRNYKKFDTRTDYGVLYLGFDGEGNEVYNLYETGYEAGIPQWNIKVYGTETLTGGYKLKRMIIDAGVDPENASYELVPAK